MERGQKLPGEPGVTRGWRAAMERHSREEVALGTEVMCPIKATQ